MMLKANQMYVIEKLDALNGAIEAIHEQTGGTAVAKKMRSVLAVRLEKERERLVSILPTVLASG